MKTESDRINIVEEDFSLKKSKSIECNRNRIRNSVDRLYKTAEIQKMKLEEKKKEIDSERELYETNQYLQNIEYKKKMRKWRR